MTSFIARLKKKSTKVVYLQRWHGWCHMKLQPSWRKSCVYHTTMHHVTSCKATPVTCHLHFWQTDQDLLRATAVTRGWNEYRNKSTESRPWRRKFSRRSSRDSNPRPFNHESCALTTELPPPPVLFSCARTLTLTVEKLKRAHKRN